MAEALDTLVVGFDLGHGETALTKVLVRNDAPPSVVELPGAQGNGRQHVTAVAEHPSRGLLIGEKAITTDGVTSIYMTFKSPELDRQEVRYPTKLLVQKITEDVTHAGAVARSGPRRWVFGAPSGWSATLRESYAELLRSAGLDEPDVKVEVVPESRAALLYARDSGDFPLTHGQLAGSVLIVDIGSSTTDFTSVLGHRMRPSDGGTQLGAGLIEKVILAQAIAANPQGRQIEDALQEDRFQRPRLELFCRKIKEDYFRYTAEDLTSPMNTIIRTYPLITRTGTIRFQIEFFADEMRQVLATPLPQLGNRTWPQAFRDDLQDVADSLGSPPNFVLLTGGASRMGFVQDITRELFGHDTVLIGSEPEVAIARGLALAGRIGVRAAGFRAEVRSLTTGESISSLVADRLPELAGRLGAAATDQMTERHVIPAFRRWRNGHIATLNDMAAGVADAMHEELTSPSNLKFDLVVAQWQDELRPELEDLTRPICNRWHIPPAAMALPPASGRADPTGMNLAPDVAPGLELLGSIATGINTVIVGVMATMLMGSTASIVLATGPIGILVAIVVATIALVAGREAALEKAQSSELPLALRQLRGEEKLVQKLRASATTQEANLANQLARQFLAEGGPELAAKIAVSIAQRLEQQAADAELLIS